MSFDRPRDIESLEEELRSLEHSHQSDQRLSVVVGEAVIFRTLQSRDFISPWMNVDSVTRGIMEANRLKGQAARRQIIADSLKCCVVADYDPAGGLDGLYDFSQDLDNKSVAIMSKKSIRDVRLSVETRKESSTETPTSHGIDLTLESYIDALSSDDLFSQLPYSDEGVADTSNISMVTKAIPWFDEFNETVRMRNVPGFKKVFRAVQSGFIYLKDLYATIIRKAAGLYMHHWPKVTSERLAILNRNFPKGIVGYRALTQPGDARHIKALIVKQPEKASQQIFVGMSRATRLTEAEEKEMEKETGEVKVSKYAPIPDMKRVYSNLPRVAYIDSNRVVDSMTRAEHESTDDMAPWNLNEVRLFLERLAMHGKNFKRIASNIPDKSEKDCVEFYYRFKIHLRMKQIVSAGNQSRQERRGNDANAQMSSGNNYRVIIEQTMEELEQFLGEATHLAKQKQLDKWNIQKTAEIVHATRSVDKVYGRDPDPESPRRERRNAMIDVLVSVIGRGHAVPPQLGLLVESASSTPSPPPLIMVPMVSSPVLAPKRVSLSMVQTAVTVLANPAQDPSRQLQQHNTI